MKASLQQQPMYCSRDHNYTSKSSLCTLFRDNFLGAKLSSLSERKMRNFSLFWLVGWIRIVLKTCLASAEVKVTKFLLTFAKFVQINWYYQSYLHLMVSCLCMSFYKKNISRSRLPSVSNTCHDHICRQTWNHFSMAFLKVLFTCHMY